jgi:hypothetical protein
MKRFTTGLLKRYRCKHPDCAAGIGSVAWWMLPVLLAIATGLRLIHLGARSLFNDELSALYRLRTNSFAALLETGVRPDFHPAGVEVFLWWWTSVAGNTPFMVRLPFALAGVMSVWLLFLLGRRWFGSTAAWLAASSLALLQLPLLYSQLARPYSTGMFVILAAALCWDSLLFRAEGKGLRSKWVAAAGMAIAFALAMYNHYFSLFFVGMMGITGLFFLKRNTLLPYLASGAFALLLFLPHLSITIEQLSRGGLSSWLPPPHATWIPEHLLTLFNESWRMLAFVVLVAVAPLAFRRPAANTTPANRYRLLAPAWYFIPLAFAYLYSLKVNPIIQHSILLFGFPFLLLFLFGGYRNNTGWLAKWTGIAFPLVLLIHLIFGAGFYKKEHYANFKEIGTKLCNATTGSNPAAWCIDVNNPWYIHYYLDASCTTDSALFYLFDGQETIPALQARLDTLEADQICYAWLRPADPMVSSVIRQHFPFLVDYQNKYPYSEYFRFSKKPDQHGVAQRFHDTLPIFASQGNPILAEIAPEQEFFQLYEGGLPEGALGSTQPVLHCEVVSSSSDTPEELMLVITTRSHAGDTESWNSIRVALTGQKNGIHFYTLLLPSTFGTGDIMNVHLWNPGKERWTLGAANGVVILKHPEQHNNE